MSQKITNVSSGVCPDRLSRDEPSFFVSWIENGEGKIKYFDIAMQLHNFKKRLLK